MKRPALRPVQANAGIAATYRRRLLKMIDDMAASYEHWLLAAYKRNPPAIAQDESASAELEREIRKLAKRWRRGFKEMAEQLGWWFAQHSEARSRQQLKKIMRDAGWTVKFTMTPGMRDVLRATVAENVSLIRTIPEQYHAQVEQMVMRSVVRGRDLAGLRRELRARHKLTRKRADLIVRDQNNKATNQLARVRQLEMGITEAIWMHSSAGKKPRPTHVKNSGKKFSLSTGWYDPAEKRYILPGELINCRCTSRPVVKGFS